MVMQIKYLLLLLLLLCGHNLGDEVTYPGSEGQAYLLTIARPFLPFAKVDALTTVCKWCGYLSEQWRIQGRGPGTRPPYF